ncbi:hypothetical protein FRC01_012117 [Tulasnella sp. 417]|nr:hypothetical protein FRC01_012117 [Tulasnella sp. 417]
MPRIAPRTEPYDNPSRQQRHYKAKRDQVLNILARSSASARLIKFAVVQRKTPISYLRPIGTLKASHVSRCNFALLFVNARGQADCYSSKLFAPKLDKWFNDQVVKEAVELTRNHVLQQAASQQKDSELLPEDQIDDDPLSFMNPPFSQSQPAVPGRSANNKSHDGEESGSHSPEPFPTHALHFLTPTGVSDAYYNDVFQRMQQNAAKIIAKCWIKIIEPKKQSRHPYREAEESRPDWWPHGIRHKEPDHLLAKERQGLLVGILRAGVIPIKELEKKTFETIRDLSEDRLAMLRELFVVAKEDERRRATVGQFGQALFPSPNGSQISTAGSAQERQSSEPSMSTISDKSPLDSFMAESFQATSSTGGFDFPMQDLSATNNLIETPPVPDWSTHPRDQVDLSHAFGSMGGAAVSMNRRAISMYHYKCLLKGQHLHLPCIPRSSNIVPHPLPTVLRSEDHQRTKASHLNLA